MNILRLPIFWMALLAFCLLITLISKQEFWTGYDTYFHMNSIYEDAMQIKTGHFSYFLSLFGFEQSGRIVNALYSPIFNYLLGVILLLCGSWIRFEFVIFFITLVISGFEIYLCANQLGINKTVATVLSLLFMMSQPVSLLWIRGFEFTGLGGMVLLPLVILMGIKIVQDSNIKIIPLSLLMAICLQIHIMTSLIAILTLLPFVVVSWSFSNHKMRMVKKGCLSLVLTILLSGNIIGAFYDVKSTNCLIPTFPNFHLQKPMLNKAFFIQHHYIAGMGHLYTLLIVVIILGALICHRYMTRVDWCLLVDDLGAIWLSSVYFPWNYILKVIPGLASIIQFPIRFMVLPFIITLLLLGRLLMIRFNQPSYFVNGILAIIFCIAVVTPIINSHYLSNGWQSHNVVMYWVHLSKAKRNSFCKQQRSNKLRQAFRSHDLYRGINVVHKITPDYMPTTSKMNIYNYYHWPINPVYIKDFRNQSKYHKFTKNHALFMTWQDQDNQKIQVPLVKYGNTVVTLNHRRIHPSTSIIGTMNVQPRKGQNVMSIKYQPGHMFKALSLMSIIGWVVILIILVSFKIHNKGEIE